MAILSNQLPSIKSLQCFVAVARELNFRRASELLGMSQPPLSRQIQGLEELLGVKLINRNTHSVSLTAAGEDFHKEAYAILAALDSAVVSVTRFVGEEDRAARRVKLGLTSAIDFSLLPRLHAVLSNYSAMGIAQAERLYSRQLVERVKSGRLDLAIVGDIAEQGKELAVHRVGDDPMIAALPAAHPAAQRPSVTLEDLGDTPLFWFSRSDNPALYDKCERVFSAHGYRATRRLEPSDFTTLLALIAAGEGLGLCPSSMRAASRIGVVYRPFEAKLGRELTIDVQLIVRAEEQRPSVLDIVDEILTATAA